MKSGWKNIGLLEMSTLVLAIINVAMPLIAIKIIPINRGAFENDPHWQSILFFGLIFGGHIAASVLYSLIAYRLRHSRILRWIVFANALLVLGCTDLMEAMVIHAGMPNMSGVWFGIAPISQIVGALPSLICLAFDRSGNVKAANSDVFEQDD